MERGRLAILLLVLPGCGGCDSTGLSSGTFKLKVDKPTLEFGNVYLGAERTQSFVLKNVGSIPASFTSSFDGDAFGYAAGPATGELGPNNQVAISVLFRPGKTGPVRPVVLFEGLGGRNVTSSSVSVQLSGTGVAQPDCNDGNGCTTDSFNLATGMCVHVPERVACNNFNACTMNDTCVNGVCLGQPVDCNDGNVCTDDLCDRSQGCVHMLNANCDSHDPCTADSCDPVKGCQHTTLPDGSPCNNARICQFASICLHGACIGVNLPNGSPCDDGNPCTLHDQCIDGVCKDPTYTPPGIGELKYVTDVGPLADGASENPIIDRDSTTFVGVERGLAAVDRCGAVRWTNLDLGTSRYSAAVSLPGLIALPVGSKIFDIDTQTGAVLRMLDLKDAFGPPTTTASTATVSVRILDLALRASGGIMASMVRETITPRADKIEGMIAEIDRTHGAYSRFRDLGARHASRLAVDDDEAVLAIVRSGKPDRGLEEEQLARFGLDGLPDTSWSTGPARNVHGELAFSGANDVLWTAGLIRIGRDGHGTTLLEDNADLARFDWGSPVLTLHDVVLAGPSELMVMDPASGQVEWSKTLLPAGAAMSPVVDFGGNIFVLTADGVLHAYVPGGGEYFTTPLPITGGDDLDHVALGVSPDGVVVAVARGRVFGVQSMGILGGSSWPRHRRDDLATGHR